MLSITRFLQLVMPQEDGSALETLQLAVFLNEMDRNTETTEEQLPHQFTAKYPS